MFDSSQSMVESYVFLQPAATRDTCSLKESLLQFELHVMHLESTTKDWRFRKVLPEILLHTVDGRISTKPCKSWEIK